jgi:uncharacterized delta-60 repeat protein
VLCYLPRPLTHRLLRTLVISACVLLGSAAPVWAGAGTLDTSYGQGGVAIADFGTFGTVVDNAQGNALIVLPDGRVVAVGTGIDQFGATTDVVTARFTAAGALDSSWGTGGKAQFDFGKSETGYSAVVEPDGRLLIAGDIADATSDLLVLRLATNGTLDTTFGSGGHVQPDLGFTEFGRSIALTSTGKIVIGGYTPAESLVARLTNAGVLDTTFNSRGFAFQSFGITPDFDTSGAAVAIAPDGSVDVAGARTRTADRTSDFAFFNQTDDRQPAATADDLGADDSATAISELPNGARLLAGYTDTHGTYDLAIDRYTSDRKLDTTFGTGGHAMIDLGGSDVARGMVVQPDGKIILAGSSTVGSGATQSAKVAVVRLLPTGQLDPTFGTNGSALVGIPGAKLFGNAVGLLANGDIVVGGTITPAGTTRKQIFALRLHGDVTGSTSSGGGSGGTGGGGTGGTGGTGTGGTGGAGGGGGSTSTATCQGHKATIVGTAKADRIKGTGHADVIVTLGGNDVIDGGGGNDIICAGAGNDHISGGAGNDLIYGQDGLDTITGGAGSDTLDGGAGNDHLSGSAGADTLTGDAGKDSLAGGPGSDHLSGGAGNDTLAGGSGKDSLAGGAGKNHDSQ